MNKDKDFKFCQKFFCYREGMALSIQQLRKIDPRLEGLTDVEVEAISNDYYRAVELAFEIWLLKKFGSKDPLGLLTETRAAHTISL